MSIFLYEGPKDTPVHDTPLSLLPQNLPDLTDLFLNFAGYLFTGTFRHSKANNRPTAEGKSEVWIHLLITVD
jgi:hypothetical protein